MTHIEERTEILEESARTAQPGVPAAPPPAMAGSASGRSTYVSRTSRMSPSTAETTRRVIVLLFGLIQVLIGLRILLLLLDAREANALVRFILDLSQVFVVPFEGILRTDALRASGSILDITAIVAFVGWTILELIVLWVVNVFRREPV
jgi:hypothetical protein